jgi:hypothetical protein
MNSLERESNIIISSHLFYVEVLLYLAERF